jgi:hypothetical protein
MIRRCVISAGILALALAGVAHSQDHADIERDYLAKENDWRFMLSPYALLANQATDVGGQQLRQSFNDLSSMTNFGFQMVAIVQYRDWILTADGTYADLGAQSDIGPLQVELGITQYMLDLRLGYLVLTDVDHEAQSNIIRGWAMEVNAGAKYWRNDVTLDYRVNLGNPPPLDEGQYATEQDWWDPMLGVKTRIILSRSVLLGLSASGGGFGIGNASDFSWDLAYVNTFKVSQLISVTAGFRSFRYKRVDGEGDSEVETRVSVSGPLVGVSFVF